MSTRTKAKLPRRAASVPPAAATLKAERVQLLLQEHPEWRLTTDGALWREVRCSSRAAALDYVKFAMTTAGARDERFQITLREQSVLLRIEAGGPGFTADDWHLARALSLAA